MERRIRRVLPERFLERMRVVVGHLHADLSAQELEDLNARVAEGLARVCGPRGFEYTFTKLFTVALRAFSSSASARSAGRRSAAISASRGSTRGRPNASSAPASRARRHSVKIDDYKPSRRSNAPTSPGRVHASASRTIRSLYWAENRLRRARSTSSGPGGAPPSPAPPPAPPRTSPTARPISRPAASSSHSFNTITRSDLALKTH